MGCTDFSLVSFWFSPARSACSNSSFPWSLCCFPFAVAFTLTTHLHFVAFLLFPLFLLPSFSCFSLWLPNNTHHLLPCTSFSIALYCSNAFWHVPESSPLVCISVVPGERRGPPKGASAPTGVEGACEDSALLSWSASNTDKSELDALNWGLKVRTSLFHSVFCCRRWAPSRAFSLCPRRSPGGEHMTSAEKLQPCWQSLAAPFSPQHPASVLQAGRSVLHSEDKEAFSALFYFRSKNRQDVRNKEIKVKREEQLSLVVLSWVL